MIKNLIKGLLLVSLCSCFESNKSPVGSLKAFVKKATEGLEQGSYKKYAVGELLDSINAMSEEEFKQYQEQSKVGNVRVEVLAKSCNDTKCTITYITKFQTKTSDGSIYSSEVRKIAELKMIDEKWKISSVKNVKTYLEAKEGLNALEE